MRKRLDNEISGPGILNYHYDREERLAMAPKLKDFHCDLNKRPKGFFKRAFGRSRSTMLVFLDIGILSLFLIVYQIIAPDDLNVWDYKGFRFVLSAFAYEDKSFVSLRITKQNNDVYRGLPPEIIMTGDKGESEIFIPALPPRRNETAFVRAVLPLPESMTVSCAISFDGQNETLSVDVKKENNPSSRM
jgi:hypothetical protein